MRAIKASTLGHCLTSLCPCIRNLLVKKRLFCIAVTLLGYFVLFLGCSRPLSSIEEEFLGSWGATLTDEQGVEVLIVWKFVFEYDTRRVVFNEVCRRVQGCLGEQVQWTHCSELARIIAAQDSPGQVVS